MNPGSGNSIAFGYPLQDQYVIADYFAYLDTDTLNGPLIAASVAYLPDIVIAQSVDRD